MVGHGEATRERIVPSDVEVEVDGKDSILAARLRHLLPVAEMSRTAPHRDLPPAPIGTHAAEWSDG